MTVKTNQDLFYFEYGDFIKLDYFSKIQNNWFFRYFDIDNLNQAKSWTRKPKSMSQRLKKSWLLLTGGLNSDDKIFDRLEIESTFLWLICLISDCDQFFNSINIRVGGESYSVLAIIMELLINIIFILIIKLNYHNLT